MKMSFHKKPVIDFVLRLTLTIIIISPVIYFSWDAVKGTSGSDYVESVVFILMVGFFWFVSYLFFTSLAAVLRKKTEEE
ncbi:conjugal transfer protein TrbE [Klebsiella pneumoniae]|uniref:conjugal transfer protein TrbE n=2 Tax=Klebsiella pneumoniae TaxID=573 RepID=UPI000E2BBBB3|nr:conjugal transfer protein TrbE [Klebsiella pneumoniae]HBY0620455.1 conjugal transfer protein TrbE [Klebsiella pneumoniae subsp. pneumoniae]MBH8540009.1 conjugal transfer protein TrbE [Klebsiella pneumoniae]MEC4558464.1 conjugal transfer protein TrbE [Klebsiella pneumoniae]SVU02093.1 conjugal transfer protein TrbE [Klebsiella pneumoniae]HBQ3889691.1 conjugal transfer protein TrbE [Klebsiella pneumoniae]